MRALIAALFATPASASAAASAALTADGDVCDTGSLKGVGALCVVTKKHTVTQAAVEFEGSLMIRGQGALVTPISGGEHALSVRGTGPNSAIVLRDEGSIQAGNLTVEATQIHLWNSSSLNATMRPDPEDEAGDSTRSTLQVRATHAHARIESIVLSNRSSINGARVNISTKGILVIGTNPPPAAPSASRWYSTIDTSGVQPTTRDGMSNPPQGAGGGYAGRGANCGSDELGGAPYGAIYGKGQCRDGVPGGAATTGVPGGAGGGQVIISASRLVLDGVITADGGAGQSASPGGIPPGGGSGGCVFLNLESSESDHEPPIHKSPEADNGGWCQSGRTCAITANGGNGYSGGSGGRIMLNASHASASIWPITISTLLAQGGQNQCPPSAERSSTTAGAAGTKMVQVSGEALLAVDGGTVQAEETPLSLEFWDNHTSVSRTVSAIWGGAAANLVLSEGFARQLRLDQLKLLSSKMDSPGGELSIRAKTVQLIQSSRLQGEPVRITSDTVLVSDSCTIGTRNGAPLEINATKSMQIDGTVRSASAVQLFCRGPGCHISVTEDGAVSTTGVGFLNVSAARITVSGKLTGGTTSDCMLRYPVSCTDYVAAKNASTNVYAAADEFTVSQGGSVVGGSVLICPRTSSTQDVTNRVKILGSIRGIGCPQNQGIGRGTAPTMGGHAGGGAGHGGMGGRGTWSDGSNSTTETSNGGQEYDTNYTFTRILPAHVGSGGGGGNGGGGAGGGIIAIHAKRLVINATAKSAALDVKGGGALEKTSGGGGSGGTIVISTERLFGDATIDASGGHGGGHAAVGTGRASSVGGGGGGGVVWFDWRGQNAAEAAYGFHGKIKLVGGRGGGGGSSPDSVRAAHGRGKSPSPGNPFPFQPFDSVNGGAGELTAPNCPAGYDGCLCKACPRGKFSANSTRHRPSSCSDPDGELEITDLCEACTNAAEINDALYKYIGWGTPICPYKCKPGTIQPHCRNPLDEVLLGMPGLPNWVGVVIATALPLAVCFGVRFALQLALADDEEDEDATGRPKADSTDSAYSSLFDESLNSIRARRKSNVNVTLSEYLRDALGWVPKDEEAEIYSPEIEMARNRRSGEAEVFSANDGKLTATDLPYLHSRLYLQGDNSPSKPWGLPKEPPATLVDLIDIQKYNDLVLLIAQMLEWKTQEKAMYYALLVLCFPLAAFYQRSVREDKLDVLSKYIVMNSLPTLEGQSRISRLDDIFLTTELATGRAAERLKLGSSADATMAYVDVLVYNQAATSECKPVLPKMVLLCGSGDWATPFRLDLNDSLVRSVCKMAPPSFAAELNETVGRLGPDAVLLDTSLVEVLATLDRCKSSSDSTVQFELRLLTVGGDRRLGLLVRIKTWTSSSSEQLSGDLSSELQLQRHQGQVITEDDLRDPTMLVKVKALVMWALGLRCPCGVAAPADWLSSLKCCLALLLMLEWYFLFVASVAVVGLRTWYRLGIVVLFCPPIAAGSSVAASCVGTVDLAFPELRATQVSIRWNLASMLAAAMLVAFIEVDSNGLLPPDPDQNYHSHFYTAPEPNITLYVTIGLLVTKSFRNLASALVRAAWENERSEKLRAASAKSSAGPPAFPSSPAAADGSPPRLLGMQEQAQPGAALNSDGRGARTSSLDGRRGGLNQSLEVAPRLESFHSLAATVAPVSSSEEPAISPGRQRSESGAGDAFGAMTASVGR